MRNLKKVIALVAIFAMMISNVAFAATFTDVSEGTVTYEAIETLNALGIIKGYEDGTFGPDKTITRAEFAAVVCRAVGLDNIIAQAATIFTDVPATHWASGYINMATQMRVVNGMGDGTFEPESPVTYEQAVKMTMEALGYGPKAKDRGGFPTGYLVAAADAGVTSDIGTVNSGDPAPRGLVARLLYKAIDTPLMTQIVYGGETTYQIQDGTNWTDYKTLLTEKLNVSKLKGQVIANKYTGLFALGSTLANNSTREEVVKIRVNDNYKSTYTKYSSITNDRPEDFDFRIGTSKAPKLLGERVIVYAKRDTGWDDDLIISIVPESGKNVKVTFPINQYHEYTSNATSVRMSYMRNENDRRATEISMNMTSANASEPAVSVIYNGRYSLLSDVVDTANVGSGSNKLVKKEGLANGNLTVLDSDNDGFYDVIFVDSPDIFVVDTVTASTGRITAKNEPARAGRTLNLDTNTYSDLFFEITKDGKEATVADVSEWDVLSVKYNNIATNGKYYQINVVSDKVVGKVSEVASSSSSWNPAEDGTAGPTYYVEGKEYELAENAYLVSSLKTGSAGTFYIDEFGKVAAFQKGEGVGTSDNYGYVTNQDISSGSFSERKLIQILRKDGGLENFNLARTVNIENADVLKLPESFSGTADTITLPASAGGGTMTIAELFLGKEVKNMTYADDNNTVKTITGDTRRGKLIKYEVNASNEIYSIEFPVVNGDSDLEFVQIAGNSGTQYATGAFKYNGDSDKLDFVTGNAGTVNPASVSDTGKAFYVNDNTLVYYVYVTPDGTGGKGKVDVDKSEVKTMASFVDGAVYPNVQAFDYDESDNSARVVVVYADKPTISMSKSMAVIHSKSTANNADGDRVTRLTFYQDGELKNLLTTTDIKTKADTLEKGDGVQLSYNSKGDVDGFTLLYTIDAARAGREGLAPVTTIGGELSDVVDTDGAGDVRQYISTTDQTVKAVKLTYGPVRQYRNSRLRVGATTIAAVDPANPTTAELEAWDTTSLDIPIKSGVNFYVYDASMSDSNKLFVGDSGDIDNEYKQWSLGGATYIRNGVTQPKIAAPAFGARDYVFVREFDDAVTDVIIIKAYPYTFE